MKQVTSPFKFLDAYGKEDKDIFFGRDVEIETLYQMSFQTNLLLVYGMSGTGKTSLIQCGLANRFEDSDWFDIFIRRNNNLNASFRECLIQKDSYQSFEDGMSIPEMVHSLYLDHLRPIYLIFDQFEELFILGDQKEHDIFVSTVRKLLKADQPCKIIISMREEYLANLNDFERIVPQLFDKRLRVEPMTRANAAKVIVNTLANPRFNIPLAESAVADDIIERVTEGKGRVQLTYLQVFLDRLYRLAVERNDDPVTFDLELTQKAGEIDDVLGAFLDEQLEVFAKEVARKDEALKWLKAFVSDKGTKIPTTKQGLISQFPDMEEHTINAYLTFFLSRRILRPTGQDKFELSHDSLAAKIHQTQLQGIAMPKNLAKHTLPDSPLMGFLPYNEKHAELFFGREKEIQELFDKIINKTHIRSTVVFGPLGVGKTSLIRAGLIPRIESLAYVQYLRVSREFIDSSSMQHLMSFQPVAGQRSALLEMAFQWERTQPLPDERKVIIFDQFEELFIWVQEPKQLNNFFEHFAYLLHSERSCDVILVVRDEFFSHLQDLEAYIPNIMGEQIRVRHLDDRKAALVVRKLLQMADAELEDPEVVPMIIDANKEEDGRINLTYLQIYLQQLLQEEDSTPPTSMHLPIGGTFMEKISKQDND